MDKGVPVTGAADDGMADDRVAVADNPTQRRFDISVDGRLAGSTFYHDRGQTRSFTHTEIDPAFEGHGLASRLIRTALDDARASGRSVLPFCPFVRAFIAKHRDYLDLVPADRRAEFDLTG
jgi:predicted GNAT family acetyltransferase